MKKERRCANCVYAKRLGSRWLRVILSRWPGLLICFHQARSPGTLSEVVPWGRCRNFLARREPTVRVEPPAPPSADVRYISLTQGKYAIVDAADYPALSKHKWYAQGEGHRFYACRTHRGRALSMHRQIMKPPKGMVVDHINGNGLDILFGIARSALSGPKTPISHPSDPSRSTLML